MEFKNWQDIQAYLIKKYPHHKTVIKGNRWDSYPTNIFEVLFYSFETPVEPEYADLLSEFKLLHDTLEQNYEYASFEVEFGHNANRNPVKLAIFGSDLIEGTYYEWAVPEILSNQTN